jgi:hypothetical protein
MSSSAAAFTGSSVNDERHPSFYFLQFTRDKKRAAKPAATTHTPGTDTRVYKQTELHAYFRPVTTRKPFSTLNGGGGGAAAGSSRG